MTHYPSQWTTSWALCSGWYVPFSANDRNKFVQLLNHNTPFSRGKTPHLLARLSSHLAPERISRRIRTLCQHWAFVYRRGNIYNHLCRLFRIRYDTQPAHLYGLTRCSYEGGILVQRSFGIRNEEDLCLRVLGVVNPFFTENELNWNTFDLRTTETVHTHEK